MKTEVTPKVRRVVVVLLLMDGLILTRFWLGVVEELLSVIGA